MRPIDADEALKLVSPLSEDDKNWVATGETIKKLIINIINKTPTLNIQSIIKENTNDKTD